MSRIIFNSSGNIARYYRIGIQSMALCLTTTNQLHSKSIDILILSNVSGSTEKNQQNLLPYNKCMKCQNITGLIGHGYPYFKHILLNTASNSLPRIWLYLICNVIKSKILFFISLEIAYEIENEQCETSCPIKFAQRMNNKWRKSSCC